MNKILFLEIPVFTGATRVTRTIAKSLRDKYEVDFAMVSQDGNPVAEIQQILESHKPDILFSSYVSINADVIEVGKMKGLKVYVRTDYKFLDIADDLKDMLVLAYPHADLLIAQTKEMAEELRSIKGVESEKVIVIENPLDKEDILRKANEPNPFQSNGCFHFLWVGRKDPIKDVETLQRAYQIVHGRNENTDLTLITNDPNPYRWMKYADCLVISSRSEASPNVLREALFLGTSIISTDCSPTVSELLPQGRIVPVGDYKQMAEVMLGLIK